jgi:hypothetical protein
VAETSSTEMFAMSRRLDHAVNVAAGKARWQAGVYLSGDSSAERQAIGCARIGRLPTSGLSLE